MPASSIDTRTNRPTPRQALLNRAANSPDAKALVVEGAAWSCLRLVRESDALANALQARDVRLGDRVAVHMHNRIEVVIAYLACWKLGAVVAPINTRYKAPEIAGMMERLSAKLYLGEADLYCAVRDLHADLPAPFARFVIGLGPSDESALPWTALWTERPEVADVAEIGTNDIAVLLATSGTTGQTKLVIWTPAMLASFADNARALKLDAEDVFLVITPLMHGAGIGFLARCFLTGAVAVLLRQFDPEDVLDDIERHGCTAFTGTPFMYSQLSRSQRERPRNVGSLRLCIVGGDICPGVIAREFEATTGKRLNASWGATEDGGSMGPGKKPSPFMRALPDVEIYIVDEEGRPVSIDEPGEMIIRSPRTTPGYWIGPSEIDFLPNGLFRSGDLARIDADGDLFFMGRKKDLIIRGGSNISPVEVETALRDYKQVRDAAVAGFADAVFGQRVGLAIVLAKNAPEAAIADVIDQLRRDLADYKIPDRIIVVDEIPRNTLTKIDRKAVAAILERSTGQYKRRDNRLVQTSA